MVARGGMTQSLVVPPFKKSQEPTLASFMMPQDNMVSQSIQNAKFAPPGASRVDLQANQFGISRRRAQKRN